MLDMFGTNHAMIASVWILYLFDKVLLEAAGSVLNLRDTSGTVILSQPS